jgi:hypothetical protein
MTPKRDEVFGILELLTAILAQLRPKDLLLNAQRVSKDWNDTITKSPLLQKILWFRPGSFPDPSWAPRSGPGLWFGISERTCRIMTAA